MVGKRMDSTSFGIMSLDTLLRNSSVGEAKWKPLRFPGWKIWNCQCFSYIIAILRPANNTSSCQKLEVDCRGVQRLQGLQKRKNSWAKNYCKSWQECCKNILISCIYLVLNLRHVCILEIADLFRRFMTTLVPPALFSNSNRPITLTSMEDIANSLCAPNDDALLQMV